MGQSGRCRVSGAKTGVRGVCEGAAEPGWTLTRRTLTILSCQLFSSQKAVVLDRCKVYTS